MFLSYVGIAKLKISQQLKIIPTFYGIGFGIIGNIA